jgi:hypothetical protein
MACCSDCYKNSGACEGLILPSSVMTEFAHVSRSNDVPRIDQHSSIPTFHTLLEGSIILEAQEKGIRMSQRFILA